MNIDLINAALVTVGPVVAIGGGARLANWLVHLGAPAPAAPKPRPQAQGAIHARATVARPLPVVEGEILPPAGVRKELPR